MKRTGIAAAAFAMLATSAVASGYDDPVVEPVVIAEDAAASSAPTPGLVIGLMTLIVFGAAASN